MGINVFGIKNCNTMKKTFQLLEGEGINYRFIDYKKAKPSKELLESFLEKVGLEDLINKRGLTYRKLTEDQKSLLDQKETALPILMDKSSMIKRPIIQFPSGDLIIGLQEKEILEKGN